MPTVVRTCSGTKNSAPEGNTSPATSALPLISSWGWAPLTGHRSSHKLGLCGRMWRQRLDMTIFCPRKNGIPEKREWGTVSKAVAGKGIQWSQDGPSFFLELWHYRGAIFFFSPVVVVADEWTEMEKGGLWSDWLGIYVISGVEHGSKQQLPEIAIS